ncbi:MAG: hypothetical protein ACXWP6_02770 [Ktedonobacterales bacterium]
MRIDVSCLQRGRRYRRGVALIAAVAICVVALALAGSRLASTPVSFAHPHTTGLDAAGTELLTDGGFEQSPSAWKQYSRGGYSPIVGAVPRSGSLHFYACGYPNCDDRVWQTITLPATLNSATLSFWVAASLAPFNLSGVCRDGLTVLLESTDATVLATLWAVCRPTLGYTLIQVDATAALAPYAGKQVVLAFRGTTANLASSSQAYSFWYVDDVSLSVS